MSTVDRSLRGAPPAARLPLLERVAVSILERALTRLEGGTLEVRLPGGQVRRFGSGPVASLTIHDDAFFRRIATRGKLGVGESYTAGEWDSDDLVSLLELLLRNAATAADRHAGWRRLLETRPRLNRRNGFLRARRNIAYHYDLGNELFRLMLDETMTYSCAVFEHDGEPLADAQRRKYRRICERLRLGSGDRVLEIGCGWGGFAHFAATEYGCSVTGLTISAEQAAVARERTRGLDVRILEEDYRRHEGSYTKIASIEMLEAIGDKQFGTYFETIDRLLEPRRGRVRADDPDPRRPLGALPHVPRLDRALRLPRLPDPVADGADARDDVELAVDDPRGGRDRAALRRDTAPLAAELPRRDRGGARARLRRAVRAHLGLLSLLLRGGVPDESAARRPADPDAAVQRGALVILYRLLERANFRGIAGRLYRVTITGAERVPSADGAILVANHESMFDPWLLALATPRPVRYMAKSELWKIPLVGRALDAFGTFPVERGTGDGTAMSRAASLLQEGEVIGIFPQGTSKQLPNRPYHRGAARLALATGAPIVPVRLVGTRGFLRPGRRPTEVHVCEPIIGRAREADGRRCARPDGARRAGADGA